MLLVLRVVGIFAGLLAALVQVWAFSRMLSPADFSVLNSLVLVTAVLGVVDAAILKRVGERVNKTDNFNARAPDDEVFAGILLILLSGVFAIFFGVVYGRLTSPSLTYECVAIVVGLTIHFVAGWFRYLLLFYVDLQTSEILEFIRKLIPLFSIFISTSVNSVVVFGLAHVLMTLVLVYWVIVYILAVHPRQMFQLQDGLPFGLLKPKLPRISWALGDAAIYIGPAFFLSGFKSDAAAGALSVWFRLLASCMQVARIPGELIVLRSIRLSKNAIFKGEVYGLTILSFGVFAAEIMIYLFVDLIPPVFSLELKWRLLLYAFLLGNTLLHPLGVFLSFDAERKYAFSVLSPIFGLCVIAIWFFGVNFKFYPIFVLTVYVGFYLFFVFIAIANNLKVIKKCE